MTLYFIELYSALRVYIRFIKHDCLQVSYTIGGCSFSAAEIEFVILKMKPPAYRPQIVHFPFIIIVIIVVIIVIIINPLFMCVAYFRR